MGNGDSGSTLKNVATGAVAGPIGAVVGGASSGLVSMYAAGTVAVLGLLTACSGKTGGTAEPPASADSSNSSNTNSGAPKVPSPLPTQKLIADPCTALGDNDAASLGLKTPGKPNGQSPAGCDWHSTMFPGNVIGITPLTPNKNGLGDVYADKAKYAYFQPTTFGNYPAAYGSTLGDDRSEGVCNVVVGVTDQLGVSISTSISAGNNHDDPCGALNKVSTAMVNHLKSAQ
ncbi:DUF3558 domain-containing protein [Amycolatopsis panacis]|uniref:DUF3558 domain-containing protein n=1 Tax=Amycolatopsis panacis TaxID=2340917 RepID=A0A419I8V5_9PSEU|nr:DUF3558 domain-containing protein [Amycolatopsis panacis]RJQ88840.1 DUF3558 domain-containing protein [Amycolatopsis panacis]